MNIPINPGVSQGWQCPICGRVYSPMTPMCMYCGNAVSQISTKIDVVSKNTDPVVTVYPVQVTKEENNGESKQ